MSYQLHHIITEVKGVGEQLSQLLSVKNITTVQDLLTWIPLRYEDRSQRHTIDEAPVDELITLKLRVKQSRSFRKGRQLIHNATLIDDTGSIKAIWFNNRFINQQLKTDEEYYFSGKISSRSMLVQPTVEKVSDDTIHTGRLVPIYSSIPGLKVGQLRRIIKEIIDHLKIEEIQLPLHANYISLTDTFYQVHFPDQPEKVIAARQRLALEELLQLITHSQQLKQQWQEHAEIKPTVIDTKKHDQYLKSLPFQLTDAQLKATAEMYQDLSQSTAMNRLLVGDVGSGKTIVAGLAAMQVLKDANSVVLIAPTQILAEQHGSTIAKLFPDCNVEMITAAIKPAVISDTTFYIGTHAALNLLEKIKPSLVIFDEQHRFGVNQRSAAENLQPRLGYMPHVLTMSATPIPRTLMLTIFNHLQLSVLDELPPGRKITKTWLVAEEKRQDSYQWMLELLASNPDTQILIVCPFIDVSETEAFQNVKAVNELFESIRPFFEKAGVQIGLLHGKLAKKDKEETTRQLFARELSVLVTTPVIEVGLDLPNAHVIVIESAERFGLASLHQLRGRVGRANQQGYCLLFTSASSAPSQSNQSSKPHSPPPRLKMFCHEHNGLKLAEYDLQQRGAGDLFGTMQSGFDELSFANWADTELVTTARKLYDQGFRAQIALNRQHNPASEQGSQQAVVSNN